MRLAVVALAVTIVGTAACDAPPKQELAVENAWIRLPAVAGRPGAAYFTIRNNGEATILEGVASPQIERIELHDSNMTGGLMRMGPLTDSKIAPGAELVFAPGGRHAMLFDMAERIIPGGQVPLHFRFSGGREVKAVASVVSAGDGAPGHDGH